MTLHTGIGYRWSDIENKNITLEMNATLRNGMRQLQRQMQHTRDSERAKRIKFEAGIMRDESIATASSAWKRIRKAL